MGQQDPLPIQGGNGRIHEQLDSGSSLESLTVQKVSITAHEVDGHAARGKRAQRVADLATHRIGVVIADPGLEQIAEDMQGRRTASLALEETQKRLDGRRRARVEM